MIRLIVSSHAREQIARIRKGLPTISIAEMTGISAFAEMTNMPIDKAIEFYKDKLLNRGTL